MLRSGLRTPSNWGSCTNLTSPYRGSCRNLTSPIRGSWGNIISFFTGAGTAVQPIPVKFTITPGQYREYREFGQSNFLELESFDQVIADLSEIYHFRNVDLVNDDGTRDF